MKEEILKISDDLRNGAIDEQQAKTLLLGLFGVSVSLPDPALKLAGKMAMAAEIVINSKITTVSVAIAMLDDALNQYNNVIFSRQ